MFFFIRIIDLCTTLNITGNIGNNGKIHVSLIICQGNSQIMTVNIVIRAHAVNLYAVFNNIVG